MSKIRISYMSQPARPPQLSECLTEWIDSLFSSNQSEHDKTIKDLHVRTVKSIKEKRKTKEEIEQDKQKKDN